MCTLYVAFKQWNSWIADNVIKISQPSLKVVDHCRKQTAPALFPQWPRLCTIDLVTWRITSRWRGVGHRPTGRSAETRATTAWWTTVRAGTVSSMKMAPSSASTAARKRGTRTKATKVQRRRRPSMPWTHSSNAGCLTITLATLEPRHLGKCDDRGLSLSWQLPRRQHSGHLPLQRWPVRLADNALISTLTHPCHSVTSDQHTSAATTNAPTPTPTLHERRFETRDLKPLKWREGVVSRRNVPERRPEPGLGQLLPLDFFPQTKYNPPNIKYIFYHSSTCTQAGKYTLGCTQEHLHGLKPNRSILVITVVRLYGAHETSDWIRISPLEGHIENRKHHSEACDSK